MTLEIWEQHSWLALPGEPPPKDPDLLWSLKTGKGIYTSILEKAFVAWAFATLMQPQWNKRSLTHPESMSPIGRLKQALPVWKELFPKATWQHHIIAKGYAIIAPGYPGQRRAPQALTTNPARDEIWGELKNEFEVGVVKALTPHERPDLFTETGGPRLGSTRFFVDIYRIVQNGKPRVIWNLKPLNAFGAARHYKSFPARQMAHLSQHGDYYFVTDLKRFYHHLELTNTWTNPSSYRRRQSSSG